MNRQTVQAVTEASPLYLVPQAMTREEEDHLIQRALDVLFRRLNTGPVFSSPDVLKSYLRLKMATLEHEEFAVLFLDAQHRLIAMEQMFRGTVTQTSVYPREVVKRALALNSAAVAFCHNHPSGDSSPSRADQSLTSTLKSALQVVDVQVIDHIVVGLKGATSMAELGMVWTGGLAACCRHPAGAIVRASRPYRRAPSCRATQHPPSTRPGAAPLVGRPLDPLQGAIMSSIPSQRLPRWRLVSGALQQRGSLPLPAGDTGPGDPDEDPFEPMPPLALQADDLLPDFIDELGLGPHPSMLHDDENARPAAPREKAWRLGPRVVDLNLVEGPSEPPTRLRRLPHALFNPPKTDLG